MASFWRNPLKYIVNLIPQDSDRQGGIGPFKYSKDHPFHRAFELHDDDYTNSQTSGKRLSQADWEFFYRCVLIANAQQDPIQKCRLAEELCFMFKAIRAGGRYFWDGE
jgi:hypothetical protein